MLFAGIASRAADARWNLVFVLSQLKRCEAIMVEQANAHTDIDPAAWYLLVVVDHCSRRCIGLAVFTGNPASEDVRR